MLYTLFENVKGGKTSLVLDSDSDDLEGHGGAGMAAGSHNLTGQDMPPRFTRLDKMPRVVAKPAGNMMRLKCPAEGNI